MIHSGNTRAGHFLTGLLRLCLLLLTAAQAHAWGPHSEITQAALNTLSTNDALVVQLGPFAARLTNYCWLGDYHRGVFEDDRELFYADDYLLFPGSAPQWEHTGQWLKEAMRPCFERALQAMRTETPANAARWVGALAHFVEDAGSPPHALALRGAIHTKMESWVDTNAIQIAGYQPVLLGNSDEAALSGLARRVDQLIALARQRGQAMRLQAELGSKGGVKPGVLECALESSRATADVLFTLGRLSQNSARPGGTVQGSVASAKPVGMERFPAKIVLMGTAYSTLCDLEGRFEFRQIPPGRYRMVASRPGSQNATQEMSIKAGTNSCNFNLVTTTNLIRNPDFSLQWQSTNTPDFWYHTESGWESEFVPLRDGQLYRLTSDFTNQPNASVMVRWTRSYAHPPPIFKMAWIFQSAKLTPAEPSILFTGSPKNGAAQVIIKDASFPKQSVRSIKLEPVLVPETPPR